MSATVLALATLLGAPTPPAAAPDAQLSDLVRKLGDKSYRTREAAAHELLRRGAAAVPALTAGTTDEDPEVGERCRQLLPQAASLERNEKLARLLKDPAAAPPKGLAGLDRFLKVTGDTKEARELYAELLSIHHRTLETAETDPAKAGEYYRQFCEEAYGRWQASVRTGRYSYDNMFNTRADITYFLFLSADPKVHKQSAGLNGAQMLLSGTQLTKALSDKDGSPAMRKIFLHWLENEPQSYLQQRGFQLAAQANLKEALPVVLKFLDKKDQQGYMTAQVMISLVKLGGKEHIPALDRFMADSTVIGTINFGGLNGGQMTVQVRDVATGVSALLAGQKLSDFGFDNRFGGGTPSSYIYFGFRDDAARDAAHAKWKEWAEKNLSKK